MPAVLHPIEKASLDELQALQRERLIWSVGHAERNNPFYRQKFEEAGVAAAEVTGLDQLHRLPFTTKADLRAAYPLGFMAVPRTRLARVHASSGTTGNPTIVGYTREDIETWSSLMARSIHAAGGRPGMRVHIGYGYGLFTGGLGAHYGAEALGCTVVPASSGHTDRQVQLIVDLEPQVVMVTPSYMLALLDAFSRKGVDPRATALRIGIFGAEAWTEAMRTEIESAFGISALDIYGLSEVIGPGVAQECAEAKDGATIWEDHFYPEVIDPNTGAVLPDGTVGELVLTSLTKEAMPVIRYRTGDLTRLLPGTSRAMRRMARISGRIDDMVTVRGVNLFPSQVEEQLLACPELAPHYLIVLTRPARLDELEVLVEAREGVSPAAAQHAGVQLEQGIRSVVGVRAKVTVQLSGSIPRSEGKARRIDDRRT